MGCKDKNVLLCQKSVLLVDKFVVIPPLRRVSSLMSQRRITLSERPSNIYEKAFKSWAANVRGRAELIAVRWGWCWSRFPGGCEGSWWAAGEALTSAPNLLVLQGPSTNTPGKGARDRVYLFKEEGGEKVLVYIVISEKLFCDAVTKGCFVVYNTMLSADSSVTSWIFLLKTCHFNASLVAAPTT